MLNEQKILQGQIDEIENRARNRSKSMGPATILQSHIHPSIYILRFFVSNELDLLLVLRLLKCS